MEKHSAPTLNTVALFALSQTMYYKKRKNARTIWSLIERFFSPRPYAKNR